MPGPRAPALALATLLGAGCLSWPSPGPCRGAEPGAAQSETAEEVVVPAEIARLIEQLDADRYAERRRAHAALVQIGPRAITALRRAAKEGTAEVRLAARRIAAEIQTARVEAGFQRLSQLPEEKLDVEESLLLASLLVDPLADLDGARRELDRLSRLVKEKLPKDAPPKDASPAEVVAALRQTLFTADGFRGNTEHYDHPDNSSLVRVLQTRRGLPILLSLVVVGIGRRLELPLVGLATPGRFLVKYDGGISPEGEPRGDIILDPFDGGEEITVQRLNETIPSFDESKHLQPAEPRAVVRRMLANLVSHFAAVDRFDDSERASAYRDLFGPGDE